jgi:hypothetical protein
MSINHKCTQPCYLLHLLRRRRGIGILQRGVLGYVLPRLSFLWCYGVFRYSVSLKVILIFKDIIYVIIILYIHGNWLSVSIFGHMCGTIDPGSSIWWVLGFGIKTGYDKWLENEIQLQKMQIILGWILKGRSTQRTWPYHILISNEWHKITWSQTLKYFSINICTWYYPKFLHACSYHGQ